MARVTSKRQVTIPKAIADRYGIAPGDEIEFLPAADAIRVQPAGASRVSLDRSERLERFDRATARQQGREAAQPRAAVRDGRGWWREDLYERARAR